MRRASCADCTSQRGLSFATHFCLQQDTRQLSRLSQLQVSEYIYLSSRLMGSDDVRAQSQLAALDKDLADLNQELYNLYHVSSEVFLPSFL